MTLLSDCGMAPMMIDLVPEVNRAFSAGVFFIPQILGRCPRLPMRPRLWRSPCSKQFANQNAAIKVLPFEGVYALVRSIFYHFLSHFCQRVRCSHGGCGAGVCDCRCTNRLHFGGTRTQEKI